VLEEFRNAFNKPNNGHIQLIIINVVVFIVLGILMVLPTILGYEDIFRVVHRQFVIPPVFTDYLARPWTIITYSFAHDLSGVLHILFNMLFLYWFGKLFVEYLGSDKLIALYILGALAAAGFYLLIYNTVPFFRAQSNFPGMVGASGAVYAIMVGAATLLPDYTFFLLFLGPVRIKYIAAAYIFVSFLGWVGSNAGGNIAHLGGALMGFVYIKQLQAGVNWGGWVTAVLEFLRDLFKPRAKVKVTYRKTGKTKSSASASKASQEEIDAILDKISDRGYESLSKDEKEKLFNASKK
jgi:membrane associated rhomboid family serine protease